MIPLDVVLAPSLLAAVRLWKDPQWAEMGAPYPGLRAAASLWHGGADFRAASAEWQS
jgi:hypothetical protein